MITAAVCTVLASAPAVVGQTTRPAAPAGIDKLTADVWTCPTHKQFRMTGRDVCPICGKDLERRQLTLQGPGALGDVYALDTCPVSGRELGKMGRPIVMTYEGREVRLCCKNCIEKFEADATRYLEQIDRKIIEQQLPYYPMTTCPVSKEPLDAMGGAVDHVHNNRLVRFCCKGCLGDFRKDPAAYLGALDEAVIAQQTKSYPLSSCMISGLKLGTMGEPVDYILANRLVRFCCGGCVGTFNRGPAAHLETLTKAWGDARPAKPAPRGHDKDRHRGDDHGHDHDH
jgi:YHS domain-containing protein